MKIRTEDYAELKSRIEKIIKKYGMEAINHDYSLCLQNPKIKDARIPVIYSLYRIAERKEDGTFDWDFIDKLEYLNDTHRRTALLKIAKDLKLFD